MMIFNNVQTPSVSWLVVLPDLTTLINSDRLTAYWTRTMINSGVDLLILL